MIHSQSKWSLCATCEEEEGKEEKEKEEAAAI